MSKDSSAEIEKKIGEQRGTKIRTTDIKVNDLDCNSVARLCRVLLKNA
jgi:hypothetical protein